MPSPRTSCSARPAVLALVVLLASLQPGRAVADGLLSGFSGNVESTYSHLSTRTKDDAGTTRNEFDTVDSTVTLRLNHDILPKLNLDASTSYQKIWSDPSSGPESEITRLRPHVWLNLRDPLLNASIGWDRQEERVDVSRLSDTTLLRDAYNANLNWRPTDLPWTQLRYTRTLTRDDDRDFLDTVEDYLFLKSEYRFRGLDVYYAGTFVDTDDRLRDRESRRVSHEGRLIYDATFLDDRISVNTDNRITRTDLKNSSELPLPPASGLSSIDDTPVDGALTANPALVDGDRTASAGVNLGFPGLGGDFGLRNIGLDFFTPVQVNRLHVWVDGWGADPLPSDLATWFFWDVYTSTDNLTWTFHTKVQPAIFGPFDRRFEINFPAVTTRYIKVVTRPLPGGVIGATNSSLFPNILVTEIEAFVSKGGTQTTRRTDQTLQNYNLTLRALLLRLPTLYYQFSGYYYEFDPGSQRRYNMAHGLYLTHRFSPILSTNANASFEWGKERGDRRTAALYYAALAATPLRTLTNSFVVTGNNQWIGKSRSFNNNAALYNTATLYRGVDASLNLGLNLSTEETEDNDTTHRRDLYVNVGTGVTPHPTLTLTTYYLGRLTHTSGSASRSQGDWTEHRFDVGLSFSPFRSLSLSAAVYASWRTDQETQVIQNYGLNWAPFPDGNLQLTLYYSENYYPDSSRIVQPTVRWYFTPKRRSYFEASYQFGTSDAGSVETRTHLFSTALKIHF